MKILQKIKTFIKELFRIRNKGGLNTKPEGTRPRHPGPRPNRYSSLMNLRRNARNFNHKCDCCGCHIKHD
jgi:hypothetical protein